VDHEAPSRHRPRRVHRRRRSACAPSARHRRIFASAPRPR
jgi:hypothetical protein